MWRRFVRDTTRRATRTPGRQGGADPGATPSREHGHPADLAAGRDVDAAGADRRIVGDGKEVVAVHVALIHLEIGGHALLLDEYGEAHLANGRLVREEVGPANREPPRAHTFSSSCSRLEGRGLPRGRARSRRRS
jgi:hypothetical protein